MKETTLKSVIYTRYSPRPSAEECRSIEKQIAACTQYCQMNGFQVIGTYQDRAMSGGRADNRPGLQEALNVTCTNKACLVVYSLSRLARSTRDAIDISEQLDHCKANLVSLSESIDTTSAMGRAFFKIIAVLAELEREQNAERTSNAMLYYQQTGRRMSNKTPYGFVPAPGDSAMMIEDAIEQDNIKEIVRLRKAGIGLRAICREFNSQCRMPRPCPVIDNETGKYEKNQLGNYVYKPGQWNHSLIKRILKRHQ